MIKVRREKNVKKIIRGKEDKRIYKEEERKTNIYIVIVLIIYYIGLEKLAHTHLYISTSI